MKKRSLHKSALALALLLLGLTLLAFFYIMLPLERWLINGARILLLAYPRHSASELANIPAETLAGTAPIIGKRSDEFQHTLIIAKGRLDGVREGAEVRKDEVLIGFISKLGDRTAQVELATSPSRSLFGFLERSGIPLELEGRGAGIFQTRLPRASDVLPGDIVLWQSDRKLIVGSVADIIDVASNPFLTILIENPINTTTLTSITYSP